jgi:ATPases of the AAA+ class
MIDKFAKHIRNEDIITPVLNSEVLDSINEIKTNFFHSDKLIKFKINPFSRILFSGQSGCGKNLAAGYLAKELKLKFYKTKPETFMGHPKDIFQNLRIILDAASQTNNYVLYVEDYSEGLNMYNKPKDWLQLLLDEYDLKHSLIIVEETTVDYYNNAKDKVKDSNSIFDYHIVIPGPSRETTEKIVKQKLLCFNTSDIDWDIIYDKVFSKRLSCLQLKKISNEIGTYCFENNIEDISTEEFLKVMHHYRNSKWDNINR